MAQVGEKPFATYLGQGAGYGVVVGMGFAFAILMIGITWVQKHYTHLDPSKAAEFIRASSSVRPGLVACGVVSAWVWSATLLVSSAATYSYGISAAWWYGAGGSLQIVAFAMVASKVKQNANGASTFLQIVRARYGVACHIMFSIYALLCVHIVSGSLVLGASATVNALTGMPIEACCFLMPIGIGLYVIAGGLRATFYADYAHTLILFIVIFIFVFKAYVTSPEIGSAGVLWDKLQQAAVDFPRDGNAEHSWTTFRSKDGLIFAVCTAFTGASAVLTDQGYWQRAIASRPESTSAGYLLGGVAWYSIPWAFGTMMGLGARALITDPKFPTYPYALSAAQQSAGLVAPATAVTLMGKSGALAMLLLAFMSATSSTSAELIAVSSIIVYDIIPYWRPLSSSQIVRVSHYIIGGFSCWMGVLAVILNKAGIDLGWLFYVQSVLLMPAIVPIGLTVTWKRQSRLAAMGGALTGSVCALFGWLFGCWKVYGKIDIPNLALPYSCLCGAVPALVISTVVTLTISYVAPDTQCDWSTTRAISDADAHSSTIEERSKAVDEDEDEKKDDGAKVKVASANSINSNSDSDQHPVDRVALQRTFVRATWTSLIYIFIVYILIPAPLFFTSYIFSRKFFIGWITISIIWLSLAALICIVMPVLESLAQIKGIAAAVVGIKKKEEIV